MTRYRWFVLIALIAVAHGIFFIWYQQPDWHTTFWPDQVCSGASTSTRSGAVVVDRVTPVPAKPAPSLTDAPSSLRI